NPGAVSPGVDVSPGTAPVGAAVGLKTPDATLGTTMADCERLDCRADMISPGRAGSMAACLNSCFSGAGVVSGVSDRAGKANGLATAMAATALMAVESLRRRRFGTGSLLNLDNESSGL